eukprot:TRINITY_DN6548_c0_g1_i1.p1 TRINITY_DN6548_c0_g1~~TRINITY_DN6548_c0_g1_i1.p1  ORF type:complete len:1106 (+),score=432.25 TRINITY_DN6548_c0_g1_i1:73-3390(+)
MSLTKFPSSFRDHGSSGKSKNNSKTPSKSPKAKSPRQIYNSVAYDFAQECVLSSETKLEFPRYRKPGEIKVADREYRDTSISSLIQRRRAILDTIDSAPVCLCSPTCDAGRCQRPSATRRLSRTDSSSSINAEQLDSLVSDPASSIVTSSESISSTVSGDYEPVPVSAREFVQHSVRSLGASYGADSSYGSESNGGDGAVVPSRSFVEVPMVNRMLAQLNADQMHMLVMELVRSVDPNRDEFLYQKLTQDLRFQPEQEDFFKSGNFSWNEIFQKAVEAIRNLKANTRQEERMRVYEELARHSSNFIYTAVTYGKLIINEAFLDAKDKTIKPVPDADERGVAGGEKYVCKGIIFKFAVRTRKTANLFNTDEDASKVAGHELKALDQLFGTWAVGLHFPMMILLDYRGFRLIAMSILPISKETIIYGSSDGGKTVHTDSQLMTNYINRATRKLNLKEHRVGNRMLNQLITTPVDLEGHYGSDKRMYLLDFSRLFPPEAMPPSQRRSTYLTHMLRPEFVKSWRTPLCSDAFSPFIYEHDPEEHQAEVREATEYLRGTVVKEFAMSLVNCAEANFMHSLHSMGINVRLLGLVRSHLSDDVDWQRHWRTVILLEMLMRTIKQRIRHRLREKMRKLKQPGEEYYKIVVIKSLNKLFGDVPKSDLYWRTKLKQLVADKFEAAWAPCELLETFSLKEHMAVPLLGMRDARCVLFRKISIVCGLKFSEASRRAFQDPGVFKFQKPLDISDLERIGDSIKMMNIAQHSEGFVLNLKASKREGEESRRLHRLAVDKFKGALESNPNNKVTLRNLADTLMFLEEYDNARYYYEKAIKSDPRDTSTLFKFACFLEKRGVLDQAEDYYLRSLEADGAHSNCLTVYADFLATSRGNLADAERMYQCAISADGQNSYALHNYALFLACARSRFDDAERMLTQALELNLENSLHYHNYALFQQKIRKNSKKSAELFHRTDEIKKKHLNRSMSSDEISAAAAGLDSNGWRTTPESSRKQRQAEVDLTRAQKRNLRRRRLAEQKKSGRGYGEDDLYEISSSSSGSESGTDTDSSTELRATSSGGVTRNVAYRKQHKLRQQEKKRHRRVKSLEIRDQMSSLNLND